MHVDRTGEEWAEAPDFLVEPRRTVRRGKVALAVLVLCAMVMTLLAPAATAAPAATVAGVADHQAVAAGQATSKPGKGSMLTAAPATVTGVAANGTDFNGTFSLQRFKERGGVIYAVGTLTGTLGDKSVKRHVSLPVTGATSEADAAGMRQQIGALAPVPTPGACDILTLALGPLNLNLLGLRVALDPVNLLIEAIPGAGNLLGNLLCGVAGLLDGGLLGGGLGNLLNNLLASITNLLNGLLGV